MNCAARVALGVCTLSLFSISVGCHTMKQSDTARTGIEQLLVSSSVDRSLDRMEFKPISGAKVFVETKYLDCVDKNYITVALRQRLLSNNCSLVDKAEESDVTVEVASGAVGTDRDDLFWGVPEIPLPPPSPISVPKMPFFERVKMMGTAKLAVIAYDTKSRVAYINNGYALARADHRDTSIMGFGGWQGGGVKRELDAKTGDIESYNPVDAVANKVSGTNAKK